MFTDRPRMLAIAITVGLVLCVAAAGEDSDDTTAPKGNQTSLEFRGLTRPSRQVELSLPVPGIIAQRPIDDGQLVKAGQLIAELDIAPEEASVRLSQLGAENESEVLAAEVNETRRREEFDRQCELAAKDSSSAWELRVAELAFEFAKAQAETARFQRERRGLALIRDQFLLERRRLYAPFDGVIWRTLKDVGEAVVVNEREPIAVLVCLDPLWVELNLAEIHFGRIALGRKATVTVKKLARTATVISVDPMVDSGSSTFRVKLELENEDGAFTAGMPAIVRFELASPPVRITKRQGREATIVSHRIGEHADTRGR